MISVYPIKNAHPLFKFAFLLIGFLLLFQCESTVEDTTPQPPAPPQPATPGELVIPTGGYTTPEQYAGFSMLWNDEFTGNEIDASHWRYDTGDGCPNLCGWGSEQLQNFTDTPENSYLVDGNLIIEAIKELSSGKDYSSARLITKDLQEFIYGRIDVRASMPSGVGTWAGIWMLNTEYSITEPGDWWPAGGEIDIVEYLGEAPSTSYGTAHYGRDSDTHRFNQQSFVTSGADFNETFYVFSIVWEEDKITWLINDEVYHSITPDETSGEPYPFNDTFYLIMNLSVGGSWPQAPTNALFPAYFIVDYVRVFQEN